jgi:hypothetical protein
LCHFHHKLTGFYNRAEKCLQRGTNWAFKYSSVRLVFKSLISWLKPQHDQVSVTGCDNFSPPSPDKLWDRSSFQNQWEPQMAKQPQREVHYLHTAERRSAVTRLQAIKNRELIPDRRKIIFFSRTSRPAVGPHGMPLNGCRE